MSSNVDKVNSATQAILSRGQLQQIEENPENMETLARLMGAVNLDNLFRHMQNPTINPATRIEFQKMLNKMGKLEPDNKKDAGTGPQVVINITRKKDGDDSLVIEGKSAALDE